MCFLRTKISTIYSKMLVFIIRYGWSESLMWNYSAGIDLMQQPLVLFDRPFILAFVCPDKACTWESREARRPHLLRFYLRETGLLDEDSQILRAAPPGVKARSL